MEASSSASMTLCTVEEPFRGAILDEFIAHFGLFSLKPLLLKHDITTLEELVGTSAMATLEEAADPTEFENLLYALRKTDIVHRISEEPIPYGLRSGNKKKSGKRKKSRDDEEDEDPNIREMRKKKVGIRALHAQLRKAASLDLVIMLDCTGSMANYLHDIQSHITSLVTAVGKLHPDSSIRLAFVGYHHVRNKMGNDKQYIQRFTNDLDVFRTVLRQLYTSGGGYDCLADVAGGLKIVSELDWQSTTRILFHIGDAPCHGRKYHDTRTPDEFPDGDPNGIIIEEMLDKLYQSQVEYYFGRLKSHTDKMIEVFNEHFASLSCPPEGGKTTGDASLQVEELVGGGAKVSLGLSLSEDEDEDDDEKETDSITADYDTEEETDQFDLEADVVAAAAGPYVKAIDIHDPSLLLSTITGKVTESMTTSLSTSFSTHTAVGDLLTQFGGLNLQPPKWQQLVAEAGTLSEIPLPESIEELLLDPAALFAARHATFEPIASAGLTPKQMDAQKLHDGSSSGSISLNSDSSGSISLSSGSYGSICLSSGGSSGGNSSDSSGSNRSTSTHTHTSSSASSSACQVKLGAQPFARGSCRNAYRARISSLSTSPTTASSLSPRILRSGHTSSTSSTGSSSSGSTGSAERQQQAAYGPGLYGIVKLPLPSTRPPPRQQAGDSSGAGGYTQALQMQHSFAVARYLSSVFNTQLKAAHIPQQAGNHQVHHGHRAPPSVVYAPVTLLHLPDRLGPQAFASLEHDISTPRTVAEILAIDTHSFIESSQFIQAASVLHPSTTTASPSSTPKLKFEKYNGNHGLCLPIPSPGGSDHSVVQAFSHWSYEASHRALMVVDCQGVFQQSHGGEEIGEGGEGGAGEGGGTFLLTDPAVHCDDVMKFGGTNLGAEGIKRFFQTHHCNHYCAALGLATYSL